MSAPIINQPWEDVASDVTGAIEKAVQPLLKKAVDEIYSGLLDATQDYLTDNLAFNIASRIDCAERGAARDRAQAALLREALKRLVHDVADLMGSSEGVAGLHLNGDVAPWSELDQEGNFSSWLGDALAQAQDALDANGGDA